MLTPLPIDPFVPDIVATVRARRSAVVVAEPGAGKTTRIPPALTALGRVILLQPRRVAARALARRIASEQRWTLGEEVGWQIRFERKFTARTQLLVATEGILTARLQSDPLLSDFRIVVLDEFHERSIYADLALALVRQAAAARNDLAVVVMSATIDPSPISAFLGGAPVIEVPGRTFPIEIEYRAGADLATAALERAATAPGDLLCFLPGAGEIRRAEDDVRGRSGERYDVLPLHGMLDADAQDRALAPSARKKIILATNIAETSLTIDGVTDVVDSGLHKVLRYDGGRGIDRLEMERIPGDSAKQRSGRAGRTQPGRALRLWDARDQLREHREPEIFRIGLAATLLDVIAWGGDPLDFEWFEPPPRERIEADLELLRRLGAIEGRALTRLGEAVHRLPLHPRLATLLLRAGASPRAAAAVAVLSERVPPRLCEGEAATTDSDVLSLVDRIREFPHNVREAARELESLAKRASKDVPRLVFHGDDEDVLLRAILAAYPDRVAKRREPGSARVVLASGYGATLGRESGVRTSEFLVAVDVSMETRNRVSEGLVRVASAIEREWIEPTREDVEHRLDPDGSVRALARRWYGAVVLSERHVKPDADAAAAILAQRWRETLDALMAAHDEPPEKSNEERMVQLLRRIRFAGIDLDLDALLRSACHGKTRLGDLEIRDYLPHDARRALERNAPETIDVPSGRKARLEYRDDGSVVASVKLQELFGLAESPRIGPRKEPVIFALLSPGGRPVQMTRDLRSFWENTYPEVRKELRGRYPRHPWPEDPWTAVATARAKRR
ncbi:MAG: ATP-dependent helicase HrpB [Thermoanaerobaculia bacterium]